MPSLTTTRPAEPHAEAKARLAAAVETARDEILDLSHRIHADPEPAFEEHHAAAWIAEVLARHGFEVDASGRQPRDRDPGDEARRPGRRRARGSASSPSTTRSRVSATAAATTRWRRRVSAPRSPWRRWRTSCPGEIVFLGTPAEERGSGKAIMIEDGLFDGLDAALLYHPCDRNHVRSWPLASEDVDVVFHGLQAHASSDPWKGRNALDALILLFTSVGLWRQQLRTTARVHGIVREGGTAANIIPERTSAWFMIRSDDEAYYETMRTRFRELCEAAALATGTTVEVTFSGGASTMKNNEVLAARFQANMAAYGIVDQGDDANAGSTDMGNVSWVCPTIHPDLAIARKARPGHSILFRDAAATPRADETTLLAATLVAQTAYDLYADPELVAAAWREFRGD